MKKKIKKRLMLFLTILGPAIVLLYVTLDHFGVIDKFTNQDDLEQGIGRLQNPYGYPYTYVYNDSTDKEHFDILFKIIRQNAKWIRGDKKKLDFLELLDQGHVPDLIATAGEPIKIKGLIDSYPQEDKYFYADNHPILVIFNSPRDGGKGKGKGGKVCTIGDLKKWSEKRKLKYIYIIGGIGITILTTAIAIMQLRIE